MIMTLMTSVWLGAGEAGGGGGVFVRNIPFKISNTFFMWLKGIHKVNNNKKATVVFCLMILCTYLGR